MRTHPARLAHPRRGATSCVRKATYCSRCSAEYRIPAYDTKKVPLDSDDDWHFALADKPWSEETMRTKTLEYMSLKIEADDADLQEEGTHAMWEFATNKAHHETFTHEVRVCLLLQPAIRIWSSCGPGSTVTRP